VFELTEVLGQGHGTSFFLLNEINPIMAFTEMNYHQKRGSYMKFPKACITIAVLSTALVTGCDIDQTEETRLPDVDVNVDAGQLPEYEVKQTQEGKLPDVDVDAKEGNMPEFEVRGPEVSVGTKTVEVEVPTVDVDIPDEEDNEPNR
jgi:sporulation protein YlmC with PRC-barrel domain